MTDSELPARPREAVDDVEDSSSESSPSECLDLTKDDGWEDVEPDEEVNPVVDLFSDKVFPDTRSMLQHCKENFNFDLVKVQKELGLDFLGSIKLVNYIRSEVQSGNTKPDVSSNAPFEDDKYLKPVLEDDALLYTLEDISDGDEDLGQQAANPTSRIRDLEEELSRLREEFVEYKNMVQRSLSKQLGSEVENGSQIPPNQSQNEHVTETRRYKDAEAGYFTSYAYNTIHESMLKDTVRTDSYRDFIYDNKSIFKDKVVLDVGCGSGILSMFCAKAGARMVIAVDNSDIIDKARQIVYENGFGDVIKCIRGKIEEVVLPVKQVDVIVSEWMGYCLLFEAMLDSVLFARDRYLAHGGLMVPSHATLRIAPIADSDFIDEHISFWNSVYGFKMSGMLENVYDEVLIQTISPSAMVADSALFLSLPLHTITVEELTFVKEFKVAITKDADTLDGWLVWFDMFFMPSCESKLADNATPGGMKKSGYVAFTTGPDGKETHWQQGVFLINRGKHQERPLKKGQVIKGKIGYKKKEEQSRLLDIDIEWAVDEEPPVHQEWALQ
ncbi:protein arginine N-methyltransferase, putative [Coccidioides posadasii C735 delta SOWgp]|uniref:type I protein arginine methyltransferase n=1 Tax=Coccidioides posadasii (strain C735) TaxID=222929 RepID=C5PA67_COCP7|nr:S-adenosylmethionine-dependent methyltransferase superfamily domain-containing protein [Coccidioides posadasii C735 delta SOWgp]EER26629.1 protein arginine N-methyltransferase, putative [Coccidioides posadasii C735 delta SOWgp]|eukprot:XP_003068774.1 S-adenosylmethionine-dependent methyltransferase superfamily domain-containing protein [Coccidioides posadasii C735 delta SOWgp]